MAKDHSPACARAVAERSEHADSQAQLRQPSDAAGGERKPGGGTLEDADGRDVVVDGGVIDVVVSDLEDAHGALGLIGNVELAIVHPDAVRILQARRGTSDGPKRWIVAMKIPVGVLVTPRAQLRPGLSTRSGTESDSAFFHGWERRHPVAGSGRRPRSLGPQLRASSMLPS
jgi:hypothetical protein